MKYKFYPKESRLYDFLQFPRLIYYRDEYDKRKEDSSYGTIVTEEYLNLISRVENRLKPFEGR